MSRGRSGLPAPDLVLLVGVDRYLPAQGSQGVTYPNLEGAVQDVLRMEKFLRGQLGVPSSAIEKLLSPLSPHAEARGDLPTYEQLVEGINRLSEQGRSGEQALIHYAGHGARVKTAFPRIKGRDGVDEALVPWNIGDASARYLRDVELALLISRFVEKRIHLTLMLDSCHSGGAIRDYECDRDAVPRELGRIDASRRRVDSGVAPKEELAETWQRLEDRGGGRPSGWLPRGSGYVLMAACEENQKALEYAFDGTQKAGVFSHHLLEVLEAGFRMSYRRLHDRVMAGVQSAFAEQTPVLEGEVDRLIFDSLAERPPRGVQVIRVDPERRRVLLWAGAAQGVLPGARFEITADQESRTRPLAVKVVETGATVAWAEAARAIRPGEAEPGRDAEPIGIMPQCSIRLGELGTRLRQKIGRTLGERADGFLRVVVGPEEATFQLALDAQGALVVQDNRGHRLPNQDAVDSREVGAVDLVVERLIRLVRFRSLATLPGPAEGSLLAGALAVDLWVRDESGREVESLAEAVTTGRARPRPIADGQRLRLEVRNVSSQALNLTMLNLRPDWSIAQVYPSLVGRRSEPLPPDSVCIVPFRARLRPGVEAAPERIKIFATAKASDFRWLLLPPLSPRRGSSDEPQMETGAVERWALEPEAVAARGWTMEEICLRIVPRDARMS